MVDSTTHEFRDLSPPGEILEEALEERGMPSAELARRTGLSEKHVSQIVNGKVPLSMDVALLLERVFGIPANFWCNLEANYREELKRREQSESLKAHAGWMREFPFREMIKRGYIEDVGRSAVARVEALLDFFAVTSPTAWEKQWEHATAKFRKSPSFDPSRCVLTAWLRQAEIQSQGVECQPYDQRAFRLFLREARGLTTAPPEEFLPKLIEGGAARGVAVSFVPALPGLGISGATRWFGPSKAAIHLSLRHKSDDQLWFSFFHEACHVLEHKTNRIYIDKLGNPEDDPEEQEANRFARDLLISPGDYERIASVAEPSSAQIRGFAKSIGVSPGIVVGRLQFEDILPRTHGNKLKRWFKWGFE